MALVSVNRPGDITEQVESTQLLWMRVAFDTEVPDTTKLTLSNRALFSSDSLSDLKAKFTAAGQTLVVFSPPAGSEEMVVNAQAVVRVEQANAAIDHAMAQAVLIFGPRLAVRETVDAAKQMLGI